MSGAEEICVVPEQEREPEATGSVGPSEGSQAKPKKSRSSRSSRAGLLFPVSRVERQLRRGRFAERLGARAPVYLAAVLQCVTHKALDLAGQASKKSEQQRIAPSHLQAAMRKSSVLKQVLQDAMPNCSPTRRAAAPPIRETTKGKKRSPRRKAAPGRAAAAAKKKGSSSFRTTPANTYKAPAKSSTVV